MYGNAFPHDIDSFNFSIPDISMLNGSLNMNDALRATTLGSSVFSQDKCIESHQQEYIKQKKQPQAEDIQNINSWGNRCNCKKAKCLKKYCSCYSSGKACLSSCICIDCSNKQEHQPHTSPPEKEKEKKVGGCKCKKSHCLKKYCTCWNENKKCGQSCQCEGCFNNQSMTEQKKKQPQRVEIVKQGLKQPQLVESINLIQLNQST